MMARISPLRMSKETSRSALTPPNDSETFSSESSTSPAAMAAALGRRRLRLDVGLHSAASRMGCSGARGIGLHVDDAHVALDDALAAVLERHLGGDVALLGAVVERLDERPVAIGDEGAAHLLRARQLAVVGVELLVQDQEAPDLRGRHLRLLGQRPVELVDALGDHLVDLRVGGQLLVAGVGDVVALGPVADRGQVDVDEHRHVVAPLAEGDRLAHLGIELDAVLEVLRREQRAVVEAARRPWRDR